MKKAVASEAAWDLASADARDKLKRIHKLSPERVQVRPGSIEGERATLVLWGHVQGGRVRGTAEMVKADGQWKLVKETWSIRVVPEPGPNVAAAGKPIAATLLSGHQDGITRLAYTPDGQYLLSLSNGDYTVRSWTSDGTLVGEVRFAQRPTSMAVVPDGDALLVATTGDDVYRCALENGEPGDPRPLLSGAGEELVLSDCGVIACTSYQKPITLWRFPKGTPLSTLEGSEGARRLAFSPDGSRLASAGQGAWIDIWDTGAWTSQRIDIAKVDGRADNFGLSWSPDGKLVAAAFGDSSIVVVNPETRTEVQNFFVRDAAALDVAFSPDGCLFATAQADKKVYLWDVQQSGKRLAELEGQEPVSLAFHPAAGELASGGKNPVIVLWRALSAGASSDSPAASAAPSVASPARP